MHKRTQRSSIDHQPSYKRTKLSRCPKVDLEHANRMRTNWFVPHAVDAEFWEFKADAGPQLVGKGGLSFIFLWLIRAGVVGRLGKASRRVEGERDVALKERRNPSVPGRNRYVYRILPAAINFLLCRSIFLSNEPPFIPLSMGSTNSS